LINSTASARDGINIVQYRGNIGHVREEGLEDRYCNESGFAFFEKLVLIRALDTKKIMLG
jgi:hypothetical protein